MYRLFHILVDGRSAAQISLPLLRHASGQVARARGTVFGFAALRQTESFFRTLVGFLFWHLIYLHPVGGRRSGELVILGLRRETQKGDFGNR